MVDADLKSYFDTIPHDRLMALVEEKISDGRVLALIEGFLRPGHHEGDGALAPDDGNAARGGVCRRCWPTSICTRSTS